MIKWFAVVLILISSAFAQTTVTPNLGLQTPPHGSGDWDVYWKQNVDKIDAAFSGNVSGADIGVQLNAAIARLPLFNGYSAGTVRLTGYFGIQATSTTVTVTSPYLSIVGPGSGALVIQYNGTGDFLRINTSPFSTTQAGKISGFTINGTSGGRSGIHIGDIIGMELDDIVISAFTGASASGLWFDNVTNWTERTNLSRVWVDNCTKEYRFTVNGGTASFGYTRVKDGRMNVRTSQIGISLEAGTSLYNSELSFIANVNVASGTVLSATGGASATKNTYDIKAECTSCSGGTLVAVDATSTVAGVGNIVSLSGLNLSITGGGTYSLAALGMEAIPSAFPLDLTISADDRTLNLNPVPPAGTGVATVRLFRATNTSGLRKFNIHKGDGSATVTAAIDAPTGMLNQTGVAFAALGTPSNGTLIYCTDCTIANPCAGSGTGAFAKRLNGIWVCN